MPRKDPLAALARKRAQIAALDARIGERLDEIARDRRALLRLRKQVAALESAGPPARPAREEPARGGPRNDRAAQRAARPAPESAPAAPAKVAPKRKIRTRAASERRPEPREIPPAPGPMRSPPKRRAEKVPPKPAKKPARRRAPVGGPGAMRSLERAQRRLEELGIKPYKPKVLHGAAAAAAQGQQQGARR